MAAELVTTDVRGIYRRVPFHERAAAWALPLAGGALALYGAWRRGTRGTVIAVAGASLAAVATLRPGRQRIRIEHAVTIGRPADKLYAFCRDLINWPKIMTHLERLEPLSNDEASFVDRALGVKVRGTVKIIAEEEDELIAWRAYFGPAAETGAMTFSPAPGGRGTEVRIVTELHAPAGRTGDSLARVLGRSAAQLVRRDLRTLKRIMEAGEVISAELAPAARRRAVAALTREGGRARPRMSALFGSSAQEVS